MDLKDFYQKGFLPGPKETKRDFFARVDKTLQWLKDPAQILKDTPFKVREINIAEKDRFFRGNLIDQKLSEYSSYRANDTYICRDLNVPRGEPLKLEIMAFLDSIRNHKDCFAADGEGPLMCRSIDAVGKTTDDGPSPVGCFGCALMSQIPSFFRTTTSPYNGNGWFFGCR